MNLPPVGARDEAAFALPEVLTLDEAGDVLRQALRALGAGPAPWAIDASRLQRFDSACLSLLLELRRRAGDAGIELHGVPARLRALARAYGIAFVLGGDGDDMPALSEGLHAGGHPA